MTLLPIYFVATLSAYITLPWVLFIHFLRNRIQRPIKPHQEIIRVSYLDNLLADGWYCRNTNTFSLLVDLVYDKLFWISNVWSLIIFASICLSAFSEGIIYQLHMHALNCHLILWTRVILLINFIERFCGVEA